MHHVNVKRFALSLFYDMTSRECVFAAQTDDQVLGQGQSRSRQPMGRNQRPGCSRPVLHKHLVSSSAAEPIVEDTW